jgi:hypothetical protein
MNGDGLDDRGADPGICARVRSGNGSAPKVSAAGLVYTICIYWWKYAGAVSGIDLVSAESAPCGLGDVVDFMTTLRVRPVRARM